MAEQQGRFGERLRRLREAAGFSQEELAERAGLSANAISALERGERKRPYPDTLRRLGEALGLSDSARAELAASLRERAPAPSATPAGMESLPGEPTPLIGREREAEIARHLLGRPDVRLLTLIGPGGVGKTRLALHIARTTSEHFPDGIAWVPLASLREAALVLPTVAGVLGMETSLGKDPRAGLRAWLRDRRILLVLDNVEHLLDAAPDLAELVVACPELCILATSRAPLNVRGEQEYIVPPLELPPAGPIRGKAEIEATPAVELFIWHARQKNPAFALTEQNAATVAAICRRLDGVPLALELAAARARMLGPTELLARLDHQLPLLVGGSRDLPRRQQTMRAAIDWSYTLLQPAEQALFRRLSVFAGGWDLEAAEVVGADRADAAGEALDRLATLVEQSLATATQEDTGTRYGLLEPIRQFALGQLEEHGEAAATRRRHAEHYLALAEQAAIEIEGRSDQLIWLDRLAREHDNLRAALAWAEQAPDGAEIGLRLATALWRFWEIRGHSREGGRWLAGAIATSAGLPETLRARALTVAGNLARNRAEHDLAATYHEQSLAIWQRLGDLRGVAAALNNLGVIARDQGDARRTAQLCGESLDLFREAGDLHGAAIALISLGMAASQQRAYEQARAHYEEGLALFQASGDSWHSACMLTYLARLLVMQGDIAEARRNATEGLALYRATGDPWGISLALQALGRVAHAASAPGEAAAWYDEAIRVASDGGVERVLPGLLEDLASVAQTREQPGHAARLAGAAEALREVIGIMPSGGDGTASMIDLIGLRDGALAAAWAAGRTLPRDQVVAEALAVAKRLLDPGPNTPSGSSKNTPST